MTAAPCVLEFVRGVQELGPFAYADVMHVAVARFALAFGWSVAFEWAAPYLSTDGRVRSGRIDLLLRQADQVLAVELDRNAPRPKSVAKLLGVLEATFRLIVLRVLTVPYWLDGVLVVGTRGPLAQRTGP